MLKKITENAGILGLILLAFGLVYYSINEMWDFKTQIVIYLGLALSLLYLAANVGELRQKVSGRRFRLGGTALVSALLVIGILALLNFLNTRHHKRIDLSEGGIHSLSAQTVKILSNLDQEIEIIGFFSQEDEAVRFQETVREFNYTSSKVSYEVVDPQENPGRVAQYDITRDGQVIVAGSQKRETIEDVTEEKLTNTIIKVTRDLVKKVYFMTGHGERTLDGMEAEDYSTIKQEIEKQNYSVESFNLAQSNQIPEDASVIISAGPQVDFFPNEVELLKDYLASGGKFFLLLDPESEFSMNPFLEEYGISVSDRLVVDASGLGQLFGFGAAAPLAADYTDHPITRDLAQTMTIFPTARSVQSTESVLEYASSSLIRTSPQSWAESDIESEEVSYDEGIDEQGPVTIAVVSTKSIERRDESSSEEEAGSSGARGENGSESGTENNEPLDLTSSETEEETRESRIVVFGDTDFAANAYFDTSVNGDLFLNVISWLAEDADLLSIRPKDPENRTITLTTAESRLIFWATVIFFPLATIIFGIAVWYRRR